MCPSCSSTVSASRARSGTASATAFGPGYQLVLVDLRGAGRTRELEREELSLARWADDLARGARRSRRSERPVLVGHSLGASVALKLALERPDDVRALVLIGADPNLSNLAPRMLASAERIEGMGLEAWVDEYWSKNPPFSDASLERDPAILDEYRDLLLQNDAGGLRAPVPCDRLGREPRRPARRDRRSLRSSSSAGATTGRCPSTAAQLADELAERAGRRAARRRAHDAARGAARRRRRRSRTSSSEVDARAPTGRRRRAPRRHDAAQLAGGAVRAPRRPLGGRRRRPARR